MEVHIRSRRILIGRQENSPKERVHKVGDERREEEGHQGGRSYEVWENIWLFIEDLSLFSHDKFRLIDPTCVHRSTSCMLHVEHKEARTLHVHCTHLLPVMAKIVRLDLCCCMIKLEEKAWPRTMRNVARICSLQ